jgi:hypothetical protein
MNERLRRRTWVQAEFLRDRRDWSSDAHVVLVSGRMIQINPAGLTLSDDDRPLRQNRTQAIFFDTFVCF